MFAGDHKVGSRWKMHRRNVHCCPNISVKCVIIVLYKSLYITASITLIPFLLFSCFHLICFSSSSFRALLLLIFSEKAKAGVRGQRWKAWGAVHGCGVSRCLLDHVLCRWSVGWRAFAGNSNIILIKNLKYLGCIWSLKWPYIYGHWSDHIPEPQPTPMQMMVMWSNWSNQIVDSLNNFYYFCFFSLVSSLFPDEPRAANGASDNITAEV